MIPLNQRENEDDAADDTNKRAGQLVRVRSAEFLAVGAVARVQNSSAAVPVARPEEIQEAYEMRAALEEIAGRAAARALRGNTSALRREVDEMRAAFRCRDLDCFVEHDVAFHRHILQASQNKTLVRVWTAWL